MAAPSIAIMDDQCLMHDVPASVDRQHVRQGQLVQVPKIVLDLPPLEVDDHLLLDPVDFLDHAQVAIEYVSIIVIFRLDYPVSKPKRPAEPLDFGAATGRIEGRLEHLIQVPGPQSDRVIGLSTWMSALGSNPNRLGIRSFTSRTIKSWIASGSWASMK